MTTQNSATGDEDLLSQNPGNDPIQDGRVMGNTKQKTTHQFEFANIYRGDNVSLCEICLKPASSHKFNKKPGQPTHQAEAKPVAGVHTNKSLVNDFAITIQFSNKENGRTDMLLTTNDSGKLDHLSMLGHGASIAKNHHQLDSDDHEGLQAFCRSYLQECGYEVR